MKKFKNNKVGGADTSSDEKQEKPYQLTDAAVKVPWNSEVGVLLFVLSELIVEGKIWQWDSDTRRRKIDNWVYEAEQQQGGLSFWISHARVGGHPTGLYFLEFLQGLIWDKYKLAQGQNLTAPHKFTQITKQQFRKDVLDEINPAGDRVVAQVTKWLDNVPGGILESFDATVTDASRSSAE